MKSPFFLIAIAGLLSACASDTGSNVASEGQSGDEASARTIVVDFPVSCDAAVQDDFNAAVDAVHNMTYNVARTKFMSILESDPDCGMAHWGVGMTYIHPLWSDQPTEEQMQDGLERVGAARATELTDREKAYVNALAAYFENADLELRERLGKFAEAIDEVHQSFPDDLEAKAFHAVTHLSTQPPGAVDMEIIEYAANAASEVLAVKPEHPGGLHYTIHAFDYPDLAERAVDVARTYSEIAPDNPHALHMPSHIFTRLGMWDESIALNKRSAVVARSQPYGDAVSMHYPHALDYMLYGYLQTGQYANARAAVDSLLAIEMPVQIHPASAYHIAAAEARWTLERHEWAAAAAVEIGTPDGFPWRDFPQFAAITFYAKALGGARSGDLKGATQAIMHLIQLEEATESPYWQDQVKVMRLASQAWLHQTTGSPDRADALMTESAELEASMSKHPITPGEILPSGELLAELLMFRERWADALAAYEAALARTPNRFNSLYGAGRAAEAMADNETAASYYSKLLEVCSEADADRPELEHARAFTQNQNPV